MNQQAMLSAALAQLQVYRQKFLDIMRESGDDVSGLDHPDQLAFPDIADAAIAAVKQLKQDYDEALQEWEVKRVGCQMCDPIGVQGRGCVFCRKSSTTASSESGTDPTISVPTGTPNVGIADFAVTPLPNSGTSTPSDSPYNDIVADVLLFLHGDDALVDATPLLRIAAMAIELELADRLLDESYPVSDALDTADTTFTH